MSSKPLVSVITPFLNAERFIQETIESVFAQTYDQLGTYAGRRRLGRR